MMNLETIIFCKNIGAYEGQLTKRKSYIIQDLNSDNVRIRNDQNKLKWYSKCYFDVEKEAEIISVSIDDKIRNSTCDLIEVSVEFSNRKKFWTNFATPEYLKELLLSQSYISTQKLIIVSQLTERRIQEVVFQLDAHNELRESCNIH